MLPAGGAGRLCVLCVHVCCAFTHFVPWVCAEFVACRGLLGMVCPPCVRGSEIYAEAGHARTVRITTAHSSKTPNTQPLPQQERGRAQTPKAGGNPTQGLSIAPLCTVRKDPYADQQQKPQANRNQPTENSKQAPKPPKHPNPNLTSLPQTSSKGLAGAKT